MVSMSARKGARLLHPARVLGWGFAACLLVLPLVAMQLGDEVHWTLSDFVVMGVMLLTAGLAIELLMRAPHGLAYRLGALTFVVACFLLIWVNLAVGFLGSEENPANLMFAGVIAIGISGASLARLRPTGMYWAMLTAAAAQLLAGIIGLAGGHASPGDMGIYEVVMGTSLFGAMWLTAAGLFRLAANTEASRVGQ